VTTSLLAIDHGSLLALLIDVNNAQSTEAMKYETNKIPPSRNHGHTARFGGGVRVGHAGANNKGPGRSEYRS
jgi:hypothetical protein